MKSLTIYNFTEVVVQFTMDTYSGGEEDGVIVACIKRIGNTTKEFSVDIVAAVSSPPDAQGEQNMRST